jgi:hypothetical protein
MGLAITMARRANKQSYLRPCLELSAKLSMFIIFEAEHAER